jgi:small subunit ribosomal protein S16
MPVRLRLRRMGSKKRPFYRLVATDSRMPRDGRFIETLGYYNPVAQPAELKLDEAGVFKWLDRGAVPSVSAASLLRQEGFLQKWELMKQGVTGDELENRVQAIKTHREKANERREDAKKGLPSKKAVEKAAAEKESAAAEAEKPKPAAEAAPAEAEKPEPAAEAAPAEAEKPKADEEKAPETPAPEAEGEKKKDE